MASKIKSLPARNASQRFWLYRECQRGNSNSGSEVFVHVFTRSAGGRQNGAGLAEFRSRHLDFDLGEVHQSLRYGKFVSQHLTADIGRDVCFL